MAGSEAYNEAKIKIKLAFKVLWIIAGRHLPGIKFRAGFKSPTQKKIQIELAELQPLERNRVNIAEPIG